MDVWWTAQQAGYVGGGIGVIGSLFGVVGGCSGFLVSRGKGKLFVLGMLGLLALIGIGLLVTLGAAVFTGQPRHVWYPLALGGFLFTLLGAFLFHVVKARYAMAERRKLDAEALRQG